MSTLSDRYVWGVLKEVPQGQRSDLEPEIRAMVADAVEARADAGEAPDAAERAALLELGDPQLLAARYTDRSMVLIGPRFYPEWRRLLTLLLPVVVPIVSIVATAAAYLGGTPPAQLIGIAISTGINVAIQTVFWFTLVFALIERTGHTEGITEAWTPERLPETPAESVKPKLVESVLGIIALGFAAGALIWQQVAMPITIDGTGYPLFDPALWSFWLPWFLLILAMELVFTFVRWSRGGWTWVLATVNLGLNIAFVVPAVWLLNTGQLFDPGLMAAVEAEVGTETWLRTTIVIGTVIAVAIAAWDSFDGFRQAWIRSRA
jgi:hypothetical protein